jgi:hypothetical protein
VTPSLHDRRAGRAIWRRAAGLRPESGKRGERTWAQQPRRTGAGARSPRSGASSETRERRGQIEGLHEQLREQVDALTGSAEWAAMLAAAAKFHRYSFRIVLLSLSQCPEATQVAGYRTWQVRGRQVRRGSTGIAVFVPVTYRTPESADEKWSTSSTSRPLTGKMSLLSHRLP